MPYPASCVEVKQVSWHSIFYLYGGRILFMSRRSGRYERRQQKRQMNKERRLTAIGDVEDVFAFDVLYKAGHKCCNGVRWKSSTQQFEAHLLSNTAKNRSAILEGKWKPRKYIKFTLCERGKAREVDAPHVMDRQVHKVLAQKVLLPLYQPSMIYNNGASLPKKGFEFSQRELKKDLVNHYRRYGRDGWVILIDYKQFFPSAPHDEILARHDRYLPANPLRDLADLIINSIPGNRGVPLGVEPSQIEMVAFPSAVDNFIKCQLSIKGAGHYMDDYYVLVPPDRNPKEIMHLIKEKAESIGLTISVNKTQIIPLAKPFRFCKIQYTLNENGKVITHGNKDSATRVRRKIKYFKDAVAESKMSYEDLWTSVAGALHYLGKYNDHNKILRLRRFFYQTFGFSCENLQTFRLLDAKRQANGQTT